MGLPGSTRLSRTHPGLLMLMLMLAGVAARAAGDRSSPALRCGDASPAHTMQSVARGHIKHAAHLQARAAVQAAQAAHLLQPLTR
jgi:hypothetical protein